MLTAGAPAWPWLAVIVAALIGIAVHVARAERRDEN